MKENYTNKELKKIFDEEGIDCSDIPPLGKDFWDNAKFVIPVKKKPISLRLDEDIIAFFKKQGRGYQTKINSVLRTYVEHAK